MMLFRRRPKDGRERYFAASQWELVWMKFKRHKLAMTAGPVLFCLYLIALFCEPVSPYGPLTRFPAYLNAPPQTIRFIDEDGDFSFRPFVYGLKSQVDLNTFRRTYTVDTSKKYPLRFFVKGEPYKLWGVFECDIHLFGVETGHVFLAGTDRLGRDLLSRIFHGSRISLSIGLVGIALTFVLGLLFGGISGYFGGLADTLVQRTIDLLMSIPTIPLWMAFAAALPRDWPPLRTYFGIVIIFSAIGWTGLARVVRGKLLSLRDEDFVVAARLSGASNLRIIFRHLLPSFSSYIIVSITLAIPNMILGETSLTFIGLGLQPPVVSWGTLLQDAQNVTSVAHHPWLLIPCLFVVVAVLMFNFLGDGLRDSADPYKQ